METSRSSAGRAVSVLEQAGEHEWCSPDERAYTEGWRAFRNGEYATPRLWGMMKMAGWLDAGRAAWSGRFEAPETLLIEWTRIAKAKS